jgi:hypothetical protein
MFKLLMNMLGNSPLNLVLLPEPKTYCEHDFKSFQDGPESRDLKVLMYKLNGAI